MIKISASLLSCDFAHIALELEKLKKAGINSIHLDIMDGHFVPNLSMGPKIGAAVKRSAPDLFLHVHLMTYHPTNFIEAFVEAGADAISFHFEATEDIEYTLEYIQKCSCQAGLAFNPETSFSFVPTFIHRCDFMLFMGVKPGFGGQKFLPKVLKKIAETRKLCKQLALDAKKNLDLIAQKKFESFDIEVDGGINKEVAKECIKAGANVLVSGTYLFEDLQRAEELRRLYEI